MNDYSTSMPQAGHRLELIGREQLTVSGVEDVERFDETGIVMSTAAGTLVVTGEDLHIGKLSLDGGELHVDGRIDAVSYEDGGEERRAFSAASSGERPVGAALPPLLAFFQAVLLGLAAGLVYDLLRAFRLRLPRLTAPLDILYCVTAGAAVFLFTLHRAQGQLRLYLLLGAPAALLAVFPASLPAAAAGVGLLGGHPGLFAASGRRSPAGSGKSVKKIGRHGKNLFYFIRKCYTIKSIRTARHSQRRQAAWQRQKSSQSGGPEGGILTKVLILAVLVAIGVQLRSLHVQVQDAQAQRDALAAQVQAQQQENDALAADIAEGATEEKMKEIAREELGLISPNQRVFSVSN